MSMKELTISYLEQLYLNKMSPEAISILKEALEHMICYKALMRKEYPITITVMDILEDIKSDSTSDYVKIRDMYKDFLADDLLRLAHHVARKNLPENIFCNLVPARRFLFWETHPSYLEISW